MNKYKMEVEIETTEDLNIDTILKGSYIMGDDFRGAIINARLRRVYVRR
jgi:hypothetical protein